MYQSRIPTRSAIHYLGKAQPDLPVLFFDPVALKDSYKRFVQGFPGLVTYAVKANDSLEVLENLQLAGMVSFDVASPVEMKRVRMACPDATLHYNNPIRSRSEIKQAVELGVASWSVDCLSEFDKLVDGGASGEISVRLRLPVKGAAYDFGEKFGADPDLAVKLLRAISQAGFSPAMTFHPGTQCSDPAAWEKYIVECGEISQRAGVRLKRLNVGGGFAAHRTGSAPDIEAIFQAIDKSVRQVFGEHLPELICEPGRALVAESYQLAVRVKAIKGDSVLYLNDGIYGGMTEWRDLGESDRHVVVRSGGVLKKGPARSFTIFGPTCDSLDKIPSEISLTQSIEEEDYILIAGMGAYSTATVTAFNGYGDLLRVTLG
ncbi:MAG: type III PLP-dependent enzyme [Paracoccaceae bacterium]|nr:type III PLP-dependent enzyme [Paracoccaceae bacterium]